MVWLSHLRAFRSYCQLRFTPGAKQTLWAKTKLDHSRSWQENIILDDTKAFYCFLKKKRFYSLSLPCHLFRREARDNSIIKRCPTLLCKWYFPTQPDLERCSRAMVWNTVCWTVQILSSVRDLFFLAFAFHYTGNPRIAQHFYNTVLL